MKKAELEALGLDAKTIKAVQIIHEKDMRDLQAKVSSVKSPREDTRAAIAAMLPMIHKREHLAELLKKATHLYYIENRSERLQELIKDMNEDQPSEAENARENDEEGAI